MTPSNDNHRPEGFDAAIVAYLPGLRALARRRYPHHEAEDLAHSTVAWALAHASKLRADTGPYRWLAGVMANQAAATHLPSLAADISKPAHQPSIGPSQEFATDVSLLATRLPSHRARIVFGAAMGETLGEMSAVIGVSGERIRQIMVQTHQALQDNLPIPNDGAAFRRALEQRAKAKQRPQPKRRPTRCAA